MLSLEERKLVNNGKIVDVISSKKNNVLKDTDFKELGIKLFVNEKNIIMLKNLLKEDMIFLCKNNITDYSILINIHHFSIDEDSRISNNYRVIKSLDNSFIYTFSIIDFLTVNLFLI